MIHENADEVVYVTESYDTYRSSKIINMYEPLIEVVWKRGAQSRVLLTVPIQGFPQT
jgi:hypothetical protein